MGARTSVRAVAAFCIASAKSPYCTESVACLSAILISCWVVALASAEATSSVNLFGLSFRTLRPPSMSTSSYRTAHKLAPGLGPETAGCSPRVQDRNVHLLRGRLDRRDLLVRHRLPEVIVRDVPERALAERIRRLGLERVDVRLELVPERGGVRGGGGGGDDRAELVAGDARDDLGVSEGFVVREVA